MTSAEPASDAQRLAGSVGRPVGPAGRASHRASPGRAVDLDMDVAARKAAAADTAADLDEAADPAIGSARAGRTDSMAAARPRCPPLHGSGCRALPSQGRIKDTRGVQRAQPDVVSLLAQKFSSLFGHGYGTAYFGLSLVLG
jgi:hypothetical protein